MSLWLDIDFRNYIIRPERCFKQSSEIYYLTLQLCIYKKKTADVICCSLILVNPPGLEPGTPTLKVLCSTC